jgi:hypothetical protein
MRDMERRFRVSVPVETAFKMPVIMKGKVVGGGGIIDGTFDSIVRYLDKAIREQQSTK